MNFIYLGLANLYLPAAAAAIHLQQIGDNAVPSRQELLSNQYFRAVRREDEGQLHWVGQTETGDDIYVTSIQEHPEIFERAVRSLLSAYQLKVQEIKVITCVPENPQIGRWCSALDKLGLTNTANWLGICLTHNRFSDLKRIVQKNSKEDTSN